MIGDQNKSSWWQQILRSFGNRRRGTDDCDFCLWPKQHPRKESRETTTFEVEKEEEETLVESPNGLFWVDHIASESNVLVQQDYGHIDTGNIHMNEVLNEVVDTKDQWESKSSTSGLPTIDPTLQQKNDLPSVPFTQPDLPVQIIVSMIARFISDRTTLIRLSMASKEIQMACHEQIQFPPWPHKMINLHSRLWSCAFSPDQMLLAIGGTDGRIRIFDRRFGHVQTLSGHLGRVYAIEFAEDGNFMMSMSGDGDLRIWNMRGLEENDPYPLKEQISTHTTHAICLAFNRNRKQLATGGEGDIKLYSIPSGAGLDVLTMEHSRFIVESIAFCPKGDFVATGTGGHQIYIWDLDLRICVATLQETSCVHSLAYSPCGNFLVAGTDHRTIRVWNIVTEDYCTLQGHCDMIWSVAFSPDGKRIASASDDGTVRLWSTDSYKCTNIYNGHDEESVFQVGFSPCSRFLCSTSNDGYIELRKIWGNFGKNYTLD